MAVLDLGRYTYAALIFDCDGTLVESAPVHYRVLRETLRAQGFEMSQAWYSQYLGVSRAVMFEEFQKCFGAKLDVPAAEALSEDLYPLMIDGVKEIPLVAAIAREHHGKVPMAVASGGQPVVVAMTLRAAGLLHLFDHVVTIGDVGVGKPSPALFLEAARRLGQPPEACLVFDDTDEGMEAARRARMPAIDVRAYLPA